MFPTLLAEVRPLYEMSSLGEMPLAVILGDGGDGGIRAWRELFTQQAAMSTNGKFYRVEGVTHISLVDKQEHADQTSTVIVKVIEDARNRQ